MGECMQARSLIRDSRLSKLLEADELVSMVRNGRAFNGWTEGHITFPPTFKYSPRMTHLPLIPLLSGHVLTCLQQAVSV